MLRAISRMIAAVGLGRAGAPRPVVIRVGVSYSSDPDQVCTVLEAAARGSPFVLGLPAPRVTLDEFGQSALEFSLRATCASGAQPGAAETDLRIRILKALRGAGIEIPHAQYDIHLRDLDAVRVILNRIAEERAARGGVDGQNEARRAAGDAGDRAQKTRA